MATAERPRIVVFLDMDGVLLPFPLSSNHIIQKGRIFPNETLDALSVLLRAFQQDNIALVLSSTWRVSAGMRQDILDDFHAYGKGPLATLEDFYDITDPTLHTERQYEIQDWLDRQHPESVTAWVALDDEELIEGTANAKYRDNFEGHVVYCDSKVGLTTQLAKKAIQLIRNQLTTVLSTKQS